MSDISDLFAKDPLLLTKEDRGKIIDHFRNSRAAFATAAIRTPQATKVKAPAKKVTGLSLDDLGEL